MLANIKIGDRIKVKDRPDWPMTGGYKPASLEGQVVDIVSEHGGYVLVQPYKDATGPDIRIPLGFKVEAVEQI